LTLLGLAWLRLPRLGRFTLLALLARLGRCHRPVKFIQGFGKLLAALLAWRRLGLLAGHRLSILGGRRGGEEFRKLAGRVPDLLSRLRDGLVRFRTAMDLLGRFPHCAGRLGGGLGCLIVDRFGCRIELLGQLILAESLFVPSGAAEMLGRLAHVLFDPLLLTGESLNLVGRQAELFPEVGLIRELIQLVANLIQLFARFFGHA
jgi:hypothetical protein